MQAGSFFLPHGAPPFAIEDGPAHQFLKGFAKQYGKPKAIVIISAHWLTYRNMVTASAQLKTIHDYSGFNEELYHITYPAKGDRKLSDRITDMLKEAKIDAASDLEHGLDHGAWIPLYLAYPKADIPVLSLSVQIFKSPLYHYEIGQILKPLRKEGVMIIGSGSMTHNLPAFQLSNRDAGIPKWVSGFNEWLYKKTEEGDIEALFNYRSIHPNGQKNHPTEEHILPFFVALGAGDSKFKRIHHSFTYRVLSMDAYSFTD